jgi:hypothetical protein
MMELIEDIDKKYPGFKTDIYSQSKESLRDNTVISLNGVITSDLGVGVSGTDEVLIILNIPGG